MDLLAARVVVAGATGAMGSAIARRLDAVGAEVALAGRDRDKLARLADELGAPTAAWDASEPESARTAIDSLAAALSGLDGLVVASGAVAFGGAGELEPRVAHELLVVNALGPMELVRAALPHLEDGGAIAALSAVVADYPTAGMSHYSASKAALSAFLTALRHELRRRRISVLDVRPPHMDTELERRPLAGSAPRLPEPVPSEGIVRAVIEGLREGRRELAWDLRERSLAIS